MFSFKSKFRDITVFIVIFSILLLPSFDIAILSSSLLTNYSSEIEISNTFILQDWFLEFLKKENKTQIVIPIGRFFSNMKHITFFLNSQKTDPQYIPDNSGGHWINLSLNELIGEVQLTLNYRKNAGLLPDYYEFTNNSSIWISPSKNIDSNNTTLIEAAYSLIGDAIFAEDQAYNFFSYIQDHIKYDENVLHENASEVYDLKCGSCRHKAKLFVAFCRGVGIPARTIGGLLVSDSNLRDNFHLWAEFQNETGYWIQVDPTNGFFRIKDPRIFDFVYASSLNIFNPSKLNESNPTIESIGSYRTGLNVLEQVTLIGLPIKISISNYEVLGFFSIILASYYVLNVLHQEKDILEELRKDYSRNQNKKL